jgi:hypothetical protein
VRLLPPHCVRGALQDDGGEGGIEDLVNEWGEAALGA